MTTSQLWPPVDEPRTLTRQVWDAQTARALPGMGRALGLYGGLIAQMHIQAARGMDVSDTPLLLERPDPDMPRPTFVKVHVEDYLLHGNACHLVTARDRAGAPASVRWFPAHAWSIVPDADNQPEYRLHGRKVNREDVVHVPRGADPAFPFRGVGVVEQHIRALDRAGLESAAAYEAYRSRGMPSVAVIKPNPEPDPETDDAVADKWLERYSGPEAKPGIFPAGTQVIPLSWNPSDQQLVEARKLSLRDVANLMNLDGYWLGVEGSSHTYRSPGGMYLALLRTSLEDVLGVFEDVWSYSWLPQRRRRIRFDRTELLRDDLSTMMRTFQTGRAAGLFPDPNEPRLYMGFPALPEDAFPAAPAVAPPAPEQTPDDEPDDPDDESEDDDQEDEQA